MKEHRESSSNRSESSKENLSPSSHSANISSITSTVSPGFSAFSDGQNTQKCPRVGKSEELCWGRGGTQLRGLPLGRTHTHHTHTSSCSTTHSNTAATTCVCVSFQSVCNGRQGCFQRAEKQPDQPVISPPHRL